MKSMGAIVTAGTILLTYACAPPAPTVDVQAETAALRGAADAYHKAVETSDIEGFVEHNANDVLIMEPNTPNIQGKEGARTMVTAFMELPGFQIRFETEKVEVAASGDIGYTLANAEMSYQGPDGQTVQDRIRDFHIWKKDAGGAWKVTIDIWNSVVPLGEGQ